MELTRGLHPDTLAAIVAGNFHPGVMVELDWPNAPVHAHSGKGQFDWNGETWSGVMGYGEVNVPGETAGAVPSTALMALVVPDEDLDEVMAADIRARPGAVYAFLTTERAGNVLIGEPFELFSGNMDGLLESVQLEDGNLINVVRLELGSGAGMRSASTVVHSHEDQQRAYPSDTIGRLLINSIQRLVRVVW